MTSVNEAAGNAKPQLAAELAAGVDLLSGSLQVTFTLYKKLVLPLDGFVFWVRSDLTKPVPELRATVDIAGSLHYSTEIEQERESTIGLNTIVFTALNQIDLFQFVDPQWIYLATYEGIRFAFSSQGKYYQQAGLWHYHGVAVTSISKIQIIDDISLLPKKQIVSNSLPIWLAMPTYIPPYPGFRCPFMLYPSFLVPQNEPPPYGTVHIEKTKSLVEAAFLGPKLTSSQLATETVKVTTYGVDNDDIITFLNFVLQYSYDWNFIGMRNMPIINDIKEEQSELQVITQKKEIEFEVNYLQESVRHIARQHILGCVVHSEAPGAPAEVVVRPSIPAPHKESFHV
jgi:hypothetical protein